MNFNYFGNGTRRGKYATSYAKYGIPLSGRTNPMPFTFCVSFYRPEPASPDEITDARGAQPYNHAAFLAQMMPVSFLENGSTGSSRA